MACEWQSSAHLAKLWSLGEKRGPPGAASFGLQAELNQKQLILHRPLGAHLALVGARPRNCQSCDPSPGTTAEVARHPSWNSELAL